MTTLSLFANSPQRENIKITKELSHEEEVALLLIEILVANSKIAIIDWVKKNHRIKSIYLQQFFVRFLEKFVRKLDEEIVLPTFEKLKNRLKVNW